MFLFVLSPSSNLYPIRYLLIISLPRKICLIYIYMHTSALNCFVECRRIAVDYRYQYVWCIDFNIFKTRILWSVASYNHGELRVQSQLIVHICIWLTYVLGELYICSGLDKFVNLICDCCLLSGKPCRT